MQKRVIARVAQGPPRKDILKAEAQIKRGETILWSKVKRLHRL